MHRITYPKHPQAESFLFKMARTTECIPETRTSWEVHCKAICMERNVLNVSGQCRRIKEFPVRLFKTAPPGQSWGCCNMLESSRVFGPSSNSLHYIPVFPVSFLSKILMTENIHWTLVRLSCYFIEVRTWWKIHCDDIVLILDVMWCHVGEGVVDVVRKEHALVSGALSDEWQSIPLPWFKQAKFTLSSS